MAHKKPKTIPIFTLCGEPKVSLVRVFSDHYWHNTYLFFPKNARSNARFMAKSVIDNAVFFRDEGYPVIQLACIEEIGEQDEKVLGICSIVLDNPSTELPWGETIVNIASVPEGKLTHLAALRWFFFELCGAIPWKSYWMPASTHRALRVPYPRLSSEQWEELGKDVHAILDGHTSWSKSNKRTFNQIIRLLGKHLFFGTEQPSEPLTQVVFVSPPKDLPSESVITLKVNRNWVVDGGHPNSDIMDALQKSGSMVPEDQWNTWYEANVPMQGDKLGDVFHISIDINIEPYLLLGQPPPYLWDDKAFLTFISKES